MLFRETYSIFCSSDLTWKSASQGWIPQGLILLISSLVKGGRWPSRDWGKYLQLLDRTDSAKTCGAFLILYSQHQHQVVSTSWNTFFQLINRAECLKHDPDSKHQQRLLDRKNFCDCLHIKSKWVRLFCPKYATPNEMSRCSLLLLLFPLDGSIQTLKRENYEKAINFQQHFAHNQ